MISIEKDAQNASRFRFNRPFGCIELHFQPSHEVLPTLRWDTRSIVWLDYDGSLNESVLADIRTVVGSAAPGSILSISVNARTPADPKPESRLRRLKELVGDVNIPLGFDAKEFVGSGVHRTYRRIAENTVDAALADRNGGRAPGSKLRRRQLFNFHYADGAKMLTVGWLLYDQGQENLMMSCGFDGLPFTRSGEDWYQILVPNLTFREIRHIDAQLPRGDGGVDVPVANEDVAAYEAVYRYFPAFGEMDV